MDSTTSTVNSKWPCQRRRRAVRVLRHHCYFFQQCCCTITPTTPTTTGTTATIAIHQIGCRSSSQVNNCKQQQRINRITPIFIVVITIILFPNIFLLESNCKNLYFLEYVHGQNSMMNTKSSKTRMDSMKKIENNKEIYSQKAHLTKHVRNNRMKVKIKKQHNPLPNQNLYHDQVITVDDKPDGKHDNTAHSKEVPVVETTTTSTLLSKIPHITLTQQPAHPSTSIHVHQKRKQKRKSKKKLKRKKKTRNEKITVIHQSPTKMKKKKKLKKKFKSSTLPTTFKVDPKIDDANSSNSIIRVPTEDDEEVLINIDPNKDTNDNNKLQRLMVSMNEDKNYNIDHHHSYETRESTSIDDVLSSLYHQDKYCIIDNVPVSPWVYHFLSKVSKRNSNDYIVPLPKDYCSDPFNLVQLPSIIESIGRQEQQKEQQQLVRRNTSTSTHVDNTNNNNNQPVSVTTSVDNSSSIQETTTLLHNANNNIDDKYLIYKQALRLIVDDNLSWVISTYKNTSTSTDSATGNKDTTYFNNVDPTLFMYNEYILEKYLPSHIENAAIALYYLLHQRYVTSPRGLEFLYSKFISSSSTTNNKNNHDIVMSDHFGISSNYKNKKRHQHGLFGRCPRQQCRGAYMLPIGDSDDFNDNIDNNYYHMSAKDSQNSDMTNSHLIHHTNNRHCVKRYCPICNEVFYEWDTIVNGCAWGVSFCNLFLLQYGDTIYQSWLSSLYDDCSDENKYTINTTFVDAKKKEHHEYNRIFSSSTATPPTQEYEPRIFGFRVHPQVLIKFRHC